MAALMLCIALAAILAAVVDGTGQKLSVTIPTKAPADAKPLRNALSQKQPEIEHALVICNAYTSPKLLDIVHVQRVNVITGNFPLEYRECRQFEVPLAEGDQLDFKADGLDVGTFYASGLPQSSSQLLLIPHRRNNQAVGISFESHVFTDMQNAQIVVIDAYKGKGKGAVKISDMPVGDKAQPVKEILQFGSVVTMNPGKYKVALDAASSDKISGNSANTGKQLLLQDQTKCIVIRVGSDSKLHGKQRYPQELVVFPESSSLRLSLALVVLFVCSLGSGYSVLL